MDVGDVSHAFLAFSLRLKSALPLVARSMGYVACSFISFSGPDDARFLVLWEETHVCSMYTH